MTPEIFADLARQDFNRIPVTREVLADLETPLSVYLKLAQGPNSYMFESVQGGENVDPQNIWTNTLEIMICSVVAEKCTG